MLVDEVYLDGSNLIDETRPRTIPAAQLDGPFLSTSSLTKSYGLAGLRCGWIVAPAEIVQRLRRTRDVVDNAGSAPADRLAAAAFDRLPSLVERTTTLLQGNAAMVNEFLEDHDELQIAGPPTASVVLSPTRRRVRLRAVRADAARRSTTSRWRPGTSSKRRRTSGSASPASRRLSREVSSA